jgi:hypothetical protein
MQPFENGPSKTEQVKLDGPRKFEVDASANPADEFIEIAIPGVARAAVPLCPGGGESRGEKQ